LTLSIPKDSFGRPPAGGYHLPPLSVSLFDLPLQKSQKQILEYVKQSCQDFQAFAEQCSTYIDLYGPLVLNMARGYLTPALCTELGFCPKSTSDVLEFSA
jgi:hypothetical protein